MYFTGELVTYDLDVVGLVSGAAWQDGDHWLGAFYAADPAAVPRGDCILDCNGTPFGLCVYECEDTERGREFRFQAEAMPGQRGRFSRYYDSVEAGDAAGWA
jgi:hypothetical protein